MGTANNEMQIFNNSIMKQGTWRRSLWWFTLITHSHEPPLSRDRRNGRQWDTKAWWCLGGTFTYSCMHRASGGLVCVCVCVYWPSVSPLLFGPACSANWIHGEQVAINEADNDVHSESTHQWAWRRDSSSGQQEKTHGPEEPQRSCTEMLYCAVRLWREAIKQ